MLGWRYCRHGNMQIPYHSPGRAILELPSSGCHVTGGVMPFPISTLGDVPDASDKAVCHSCFRCRVRGNILVWLLWAFSTVMQITGRTETSTRLPAMCSCFYRSIKVLLQRALKIILSSIVWNILCISPMWFQMEERFTGDFPHREYPLMSYHQYLKKAPRGKTVTIFMHK